jgi:caffeoyl-CoA O-methyltransferase
MDLLHPKVTGYLDGLAARLDEPVLLEMEAYAEKNGFPIVGRLCGMFLQTAATMIGAKRIFEMGSGYGYSAYWFSRATGPDGEIHLTDMDPENRTRALDYLGRAGLDRPIDYHVSDAFAAFDATDGEFDIVYCDIDKGDYPQAWEKAKGRIRLGGLFVCDNMLWGGRVTDDPSARDEVKPGWTEAIMQTNEAIFSDPEFISFINPTRDGVITALRTGPR